MNNENLQKGIAASATCRQGDLVVLEERMEGWAVKLVLILALSAKCKRHSGLPLTHKGKEANPNRSTGETLSFVTKLVY